MESEVLFVPDVAKPGGKLAWNRETVREFLRQLEDSAR